jgi:hypothetical protein
LIINKWFRFLCLSNSRRNENGEENNEKNTGILHCCLFRNGRGASRLPKKRVTKIQEIRVSFIHIDIALRPMNFAKIPTDPSTTEVLNTRFPGTKEAEEEEQREFRVSDTLSEEEEQKGVEIESRVEVSMSSGDRWSRRGKGVKPL